jgi:hypothetical protein
MPGVKITDAEEASVAPSPLKASIPTITVDTDSSQSLSQSNKDKFDSLAAETEKVRMTRGVKVHGSVRELVGGHAPVRTQTPALITSLHLRSDYFRSQLSS